MHLLVDFGGPILDDSRVEALRKTTVLEAARESGVLEDIRKVVPSAANVSPSLIVDNYDRGKALLKQTASGAEAYNDVNRLAATMAVVLDLNDYRVLADSVGKEAVRRFWPIFCGPIREAALGSIRADSLEVLRELLDRYETGFHIVTDNWPDLFHNAFEPAITDRFGQCGLPQMEYRIPATPRKTLNCTYVSGEGWGNKKRPETWERILGDLSVSGEDRIFFVDDSASKLAGLDQYAASVGLPHVQTVHLKLKPAESSDAGGTISNMRELITVVGESIHV